MAKTPTPSNSVVTEALRDFVAVARQGNGVSVSNEDLAELANEIDRLLAMQSTNTTGSDELVADGGMDGDTVALAETFWAGLPTGNRTWGGLATYEKALVCHQIARLRANAIATPDTDREPLVWEATTPAYTRFITDSKYQKLRPAYRKWYRPVCQKCAADTDRVAVLTEALRAVQMAMVPDCAPYQWNLAKLADAAPLIRAALSQPLGSQPAQEPHPPGAPEHINQIDGEWHDPQPDR